MYVCEIEEFQVEETKKEHKNVHDLQDEFFMNDKKSVGGKLNFT